MTLPGTRKLVGQGLLTESFNQYVLRTYESQACSKYKGSNSEKNISGDSFIERIRLQVGLKLLRFWRGGTSLGETTFTFTERLLVRHADRTSRAD